MTRKIAKQIVKGITDKIECNTADIDDWAEFWGFTREEYEEFLDMPIKALEQEPKVGQWIIYNYPGHECVYCSSCKEEYYEDDLYMGGSDFPKYCPNCGCRMVEP